MGRARSHGHCSCGHRYRRRSGDLPIDLSMPSRVRDLIARTNAVRWIGPGNSHLGVAIHFAITENA